MAGSRTHFSGSRRSKACFHVRAFMIAHNLPDVSVVADAGTASDANQKAIENAGLSFILGARVPGVPYPVAQWRRELPPGCLQRRTPRRVAVPALASA
jgi:hypothetical protein